MRRSGVRSSSSPPIGFFVLRENRLRAGFCVFMAKGLGLRRWGFAGSGFLGLSLFCYWFISVPPVRGGTYFSLPAAKKSRQKKAASNRQFLSGSPGLESVVAP